MKILLPKDGECPLPTLHIKLAKQSPICVGKAQNFRHASNFRQHLISS